MGGDTHHAVVGHVVETEAHGARRVEGGQPVPGGSQAGVCEVVDDDGDHGVVGAPGGDLQRVDPSPPRHPRGVALQEPSGPGADRLQRGRAGDQPGEHDPGPPSAPAQVGEQFVAQRVGSEQQVADQAVVLHPHQRGGETSRRDMFDDCTGGVQVGGPAAGFDRSEHAVQAGVGERVEVGAGQQVGAVGFQRGG